VLRKKSLTKEQALQKLRHFCSYQERCHSEVKTKLYQLGINKKFYAEIIAELIQGNYLNEERFAISFARGKFKMNEWGKRKIEYALKEKFINYYCIKKALKQIPEQEYEAILKKLAKEKYESFKGEQYLIRKKKTIDYLTGRGFEWELMKEILEEINGL
jgi:regulatory protein